MLCSTCSRPFESQRTKPDVSNLLRSKEALNISQTTSVSQSVLDAEAELRHLDAQAGRLKATMSFINMNRAIVRMELEQYKSLLAPARRIPLEILNHIFVLYAQPNVFVEGDWSFPGATVAFVCRRWRDVALACPQLWSSLDIHIKDPESAIFRRTVSATEICLARSAEASLDLTMHINPFLHDYLNSSAITPRQFADASIFLRNVLLHAPRCKRFFVVTNNVSPVTGLLSVANFTNLESLHLDTFTSDLPPLDYGIFGSLPKIHSLTVMQPLPDNSVDFPWTQIRTLHIDRANRVSQALSLCSNLQHLLYGTSTSGLVNTLALPASSHKSTTIQFLTLRTTPLGNHRDVKVALDALELPALTTVCMRRNYVGYLTSQWPQDAKLEWPQDALISFIIRSACSITTLTLVDIPMRPSELISVLELTPALTHLTVQQSILPLLHVPNHSYLDMTFIEALHGYVFSTKSRPLVRKLACLTLHVSSDWFTPQSFVDVVESRWIPDHELLLEAGIECLRSVELYILDAAVDEIVFDSLRMLQRCGLQLELRGKARLD